MQKCPVPLVPPNCKWDNPTATMGGRERHAAPPQRRTPAAVSVPAEKKEPEIGRNASSKATGHRAAPHTTVRRAPTGHTTIHKGTMRCEHCSNHQMQRTPSEPSANTPPLPLHGAHVLHKCGGCAPRAGRCPPRGWQQGRDQPTAHGTVHVVRRCEILVRGGRRVGQEGVHDRGTQERQQTGGGATQTHRTREPHQEGQGRAQQGRGGNQNSGNREPEWRGWESVRMGGSNNKGDGLASQPRRYRVPGQPLLNWHQVGGVSRSPDGLFAQQEQEPIRGRPAVRGKSTYGGRLGQCVEEQGTWASRTQKHSEAGYGRTVGRGVWTAKTVKRPRQQPAHPQYANYWAPLTRKRHILPHSAQPQHTNYWAPQTRNRHQQEHRPQRPTEHSDPTQHAKGRTGDCPGPRKETTTRRNVTQGGWGTSPFGGGGGWGLEKRDFRIVGGAAGQWRGLHPQAPLTRSTAGPRVDCPPSPPCPGEGWT